MAHYTVSAPHPFTKAVIILPQPEFGDVERTTGTAIFNRAMDGTCYSTIRNQPTKLYSWTFTLPRLKGIEFLSFYNRYNAEVWKVARESDNLIGYIKLNPSTLEMIRRSVGSNSLEATGIQFDFETIQ